MPNKVYEMDDNYNQAVADLLEVIKVRDELTESIKIAPPDKIREGQKLLATMNKKIEECEAALAKEYETTQTYKKALDEQEEVFDEVKHRMEMVFVYTKHRLPDKLNEMKAIIFNDMKPEWIQDFYDNVAILEATRLEELIAEAKDDE